MGQGGDRKVRSCSQPTQHSIPLSHRRLIRPPLIGCVDRGAGSRGPCRIPPPLLLLAALPSCRQCVACEAVRQPVWVGGSDCCKGSFQDSPLYSELKGDQAPHWVVRLMAADKSYLPANKRLRNLADFLQEAKRVQSLLAG